MEVKNIPIHIQVENVVLPNKPLSNFERPEAVKKLKMPNLQAIFLRDPLPKTPRKNECAIMNLDDPSGDGTHWVCWLKC